MFLRKIKYLKNSLLFRLTIFHALAFTSLSLICFLIFYHRIYTVTMERIDTELLNEIGSLAEHLRKKGLESTKAAISGNAIFENPAEEFFRLVTLNGDTLSTSDMSGWTDIPMSQSLEEFKNGRKKYLSQTVSDRENNKKARLITALVAPDMIMQIGESLKEADEYLNTFKNLFSTLMVILIMASSVIGWILAKQALVDVEEITRTTEDISKGSYGKRVRVKRRFREIERLGATFNSMLDRIQNLLKSMKEINDNIAHDLRSPIARVRGITEMTLMKNSSIDDYKDMAANTMEECDGLIDMINTMLDITETEAGVDSTKKEDFDLTKLISDAFILFQPLADNKQITLQTKLPEMIVFHGDRKKMQRIVTNLLENAIKFTPENGTITASAHKKNGVIRINFEDTGVGISEKDLPHIFERFYRCDRSRPQGGVGLGLSLAKAYTESMNGTIRVSSTINQGSIFTLEFTQ